MEVGVEAAITTRRSRRHYQRKLDGEQEAHLIALACSPPPEGRVRWTLRLLANRMVELGYVDRVSHETVRGTFIEKLIKHQTNTTLSGKILALPSSFGSPLEIQRPGLPIASVSEGFNPSNKAVLASHTWNQAETGGEQVIIPAPW